MKAVLQKDGSLEIIPENRIDAFALSQWNPNHHPLHVVKEFRPFEDLSNKLILSMGDSRD